jgi:hypothetical protein
MRQRFPPSTFFKQLEDVLQEEWCIIPLEPVQNLCKSIPRKAGCVEAKRWSNTISIKKYVQHL